jgi:multidrug efflux pump subunit AcrB
VFGRGFFGFKNPKQVLRKRHHCMIKTVIIPVVLLLALFLLLPYGFEMNEIK